MLKQTVMNLTGLQAVYSNSLPIICKSPHSPLQATLGSVQDNTLREFHDFINCPHKLFWCWGYAKKSAIRLQSLNHTNHIWDLARTPSRAGCAFFLCARCIHAWASTSHGPAGWKKRDSMVTTWPSHDQNQYLVLSVHRIISSAYLMRWNKSMGLRAFSGSVHSNEKRAGIKMAMAGQECTVRKWWEIIGLELLHSGGTKRGEKDCLQKIHKATSRSDTRWDGH